MRRAPAGSDCREVPDVSADAAPVDRLRRLLQRRLGQRRRHQRRRARCGPAWPRSPTPRASATCARAPARLPQPDASTRSPPGAAHAARVQRRRPRGNNNPTAAAPTRRPPATTWRPGSARRSPPTARPRGWSRSCAGQPAGTVSRREPRRRARPGTTVTIHGSGFAARRERRASATTAATQRDDRQRRLDSDRDRARRGRAPSTSRVTHARRHQRDERRRPLHLRADRDDRRAPPPGATYTQGQSVAAAYACAASTPAAPTCAGTVPDGGAIDTTATGAPPVHA